MKLCALTMPVVVMMMTASGLHAAPRITVVRGEAASGPNLIQDPAFDAAEASWQAFDAGYEPAPGDGRDGSDAVTCIRAEGGGDHGVSQSLELNQEMPTPIRVEAWSKAAEVSGVSDRGYAVYCDLTYADGSNLWGQISAFSTGTHDWQRREVLIIPAKPVQAITVHLLFRGHTGQIWFDDVALHELRAAAGTALLDGVPVVPPTPEALPAGDSHAAGGVTLQLDESGAIASVIVNGETASTNQAVGGFFVRDAAANSDFIGFDDGRCEELGLVLDLVWSDGDDALRLSGTLKDTTGQDRAVTLLFALPIAARGAEWAGGLRGGTTIGGTGESSDSVPMGTGATGTMARYPFSCVTTDAWGIALGADITKPCQYRLAYNAGTQQYFAAFDFALVPDTVASPSAAAFSLIVYSVDPAWGFRSAAERYYALFPEQFVTRSKDQGIWMPFSKISEVEGWEDFGFRYKEGNNETTWDDANDILTFRYTEPSTWWMAMPEGMPRTYDAAMELARKIAAGEAKGNQTKAKALLACGIFDEQGKYMMQFRDTPWCDGAVFGNSCLPGIEGEVIDARISWNEEQKLRLYGPDRQGDQDGEYLDSLEGYVTPDLNHRREHFKVAQRPLTFTRVDHQPVIHKAFAVDEFVEWIAGDVHGMGKLMFANAVPHRFTFLCGHLDVMGTETNWLRQGNWTPMSHDQLSMIRTMSAQKPYLFLMNTDFEPLGPYVERYLQRSLFYGIYPSMFSPTASSESAYWQTPAWYNRDRELHKQYQPLIRRVAEAGWQPLTLATTDAPDILIERFGPNKAGEVFFTIFNDGDEQRSAPITVDPSLGGGSALELVTGAQLQVSGRQDGALFSVTLDPEECAAVLLSR